MNLIKTIVACIFTLSILTGCKDEETYKPVPDNIYITSNAITGPGSNASTAITNSASGKPPAAPPVGARVYVNTLKTFDVNVTFSITGTAQAGVNYTPPPSFSITIPAGKWYADINFPVINTPVTDNKTIIINLLTASNNTQIGLGTDRNYKVFTYTIQKP